MQKSLKHFGFPVLAFLAVLAVASSAHSAIQTDSSSMSSGLSWSISESGSGKAVASDPDSAPSTQPTVEAIYSSNLDPASVPGSMRGPNSTQTQSYAGVAFLPSPIRQLAIYLSVPLAAQYLFAVAVWSGDQPIDPPKLNMVLFDLFKSALTNKSFQFQKGN